MVSVMSNKKIQPQGHISNYRYNYICEEGRTSEGIVTLQDRLEEWTKEKLMKSSKYEVSHLTKHNPGMQQGWDIYLAGEKLSRRGPGASDEHELHISE